MTRFSLLLQMMMMMMLMMKNSSSSFPNASADAITVRSGEAVRLSADLTEAERTRLYELQWQHPNGQLTWKQNVFRGDGSERCQLLSDGSLSFNRTQTQDSGKYLMRAFDAEGKGIKTKAINLLVIADGPSASTIAAACLAICCFLLLTFILSYSIIERRRRRRKRGVTTAMQDNVYVEMIPTNRKEEETYCALHNSAVPTETPVPQQDSPDVDGVYV